MTQEINTKSSAPSQMPAKMTYEQFLAWEDEDTHAEWVNGEVVLMTPVSHRHQNLRGFLLSLFRYFVEAQQLGVVLDDPFQMKTGPDLPGRAPDIIFIANENLGRLKSTYLEGPADLVVEIISPESRARDREEKFHEYEQGGVREYWLIDPERMQAEFYRLADDKLYHMVSVDGNGVFYSEVVKGLWVNVNWLWREPLPLLSSVLREWKLI